MVGLGGLQTKKVGSRPTLANGARGHAHAPVNPFARNAPAPDPKQGQTSGRATQSSTNSSSSQVPFHDINLPAFRMKILAPSKLFHDNAPTIRI